jgi:hypothetical protein
MEYFSGLMVSMITVVLAQFWYSLLFFIYINIDTAFLSYIVSQLPQYVVMPKISIVAMLFSEGLAFSAIIALTMMQYFKRTAARWQPAS